MERRKLGRAVDHHFMSELFCGFAVIVKVPRATSVFVSPMHKDQTHVAPPRTQAVPIPSSIDDLDQLFEPYDLAWMGCQVLPNAADQPVIMCRSAENVLEQFGAVTAHHELDGVWAVDLGHILRIETEDRDRAGRWCFEEARRHES